MGRGDGHECPFGKSSIALVKLLGKLLKIGEPRKKQLILLTIFMVLKYPVEEASINVAILVSV